jgi:hypothetical protein
VDVLEQVAAQIEQAHAIGKIVLHQGGGRLGQQHLPAVTGVGDAGRPVHVHAHVAFLAAPGLAGMDAHAHPHVHALRPGMLGQRSLRLGRRAGRLGGAREGHEEGVALGVDLTALPGGKGFAQDAALVSQQGGIALAQLLQQAGGAFDIGEQEGDRAFRQVSEGDGGRR